MSVSKNSPLHVLYSTVTASKGRDQIRGTKVKDLPFAGNIAVDYKEEIRTDELIIKRTKQDPSVVEAGNSDAITQEKWRRDEEKPFRKYE